MAFDINHDSLTELARKWLLRPPSKLGPGCKFSLTEVGSITSGEIADAWGYRWGFNGGSVLIEVKVSRADFLSDSNKPHRNGEVKGMGKYRYYLCPEGIINETDLPKGWGLIWINNRGHIKVQCGHVAIGYPMNHESELKDWEHPVNYEKELDVVTHLLGRISDPDKMNKIIREYQSENNRLINRVNRQQKELMNYKRMRTREIRALEAIKRSGNPSPETLEILSDLKDLTLFG